LSANFRWKGGRPPTNFGVKKLDSLGYHVVLFFVILRLAVLIQYRRDTHTHTHIHTHTHTQTDRHTDRQTHGHTMMAITRASLWCRAGKKFPPLISL